MRAGSLRDLVSIVAATTAPDGQGGRTVTAWVDLVTGTATLTRLPADVTPLVGGERLDVRSVTATFTYSIALRYRPDITPKMRVLWTPFRSATGKTLEISDVSMDTQYRSYIVLSCIEVQA